FDYVNTLMTLTPDDPQSGSASVDEPLRVEHAHNIKNCNFALLCEKYPINAGKSSYLAKVLYISLQSHDKTIRFYPDKINEMNLDYVILTTNARRRININSQEFFVNGNTEKQAYKESEYYNYSIERVNKVNQEMLSQLREKYNIPEPTIFKGIHQNIILE
ncbi:hypothetical protein M9Y10_036913, partial [Tritrichomonas musculus]